MTFNFRPFQLEAGQWAQLIVFALFIFVKLRRWTQTNDISRGHKVLGQIVILTLLVGMVLMAKGHLYTTVFRIMVYSALGIEEGYNYWYFQRYPIAEEHKRTYDVHVPKGAIFVPWQALVKYLIEPPEPELFWTRHRFRTLVLVFLFLFSFAYGFSRWVETYTEGQKALADAEVKSAAKTDSTVKAAVAAAVDSTKKVISGVADTLRQGQADLSGQMAASNKEDEKRAAEVKNDLKKTNARLSRPSFIITAPQARQELSTDLLLPTDQVKLPTGEPRRKKKVRRMKFSYVEDRYFIQEVDEDAPDSLRFELAKFTFEPEPQNQ